MSECCSAQGHSRKGKRVDGLLWSSAVLIAAGILIRLFPTSLNEIDVIDIYGQETLLLITKMWLGITLGILFAGLLSFVPKKTVTAILGKGGTIGGILRATAAGVLLDLCSHGILMVGMQLYRRGASIGQVAAFLIASPWNSLSLTLILWSLIGLKWTAAILLLSTVIAIISGVIFDSLAKRGCIPDNPHTPEGRIEAFSMRMLMPKTLTFKARWPIDVLLAGVKESRMILRWVFFGIVLSALIRTFVSAELFGSYFGPTLTGLGLTLIFATVLEVCSEGSTPVAADFILRAKAPGNAFAFLMTGVSTDYTEIMSLKETTGSWKIALALPLITLPQVVLIAVILNTLS